MMPVPPAEVVAGGARTGVPRTGPLWDDHAVPSVVALHRSSEHTFSKESCGEVTVVAGIGVDGDAHAGATVRHRSRVAADPTQPNLRQVHLIPSEILDRVRAAGHDVEPGDLGENVTTEGIDLHALPTGTLLRIGDTALLAITGLRNPCGQIENFRTGLLAEVRGRGDDGRLQRWAGVMSVVVQGGTIRTGDPIAAQSPPLPHHPLERV